VNKTKKNIRIFTFLLKILLFFALIWLFSNQIKRIDWSKWDEISIQNPWELALVFLLVFLNWGIEFLKWKVVLDFSVNKTSQLIQVKSFLAGIITGLLTPNMIGNFVGRMFYFQRRERTSIILLTLFSNAAQFLASIFFGILGIIWLGIPNKDFSWSEDSFLLVSITGFSLLTLLYFTFEKIPFQFIKENKHLKRIGPLMQKNSFFRLKLLILSCVRHFVFALQYWLLLDAFGIEIQINWLGWIWQIFFWATLIPSLWFGKLIIRESMALWILAPLTSNPALVLFASVALWIINQAVPAAVGIPFLKTNNSKKR
jgi:uncharacterized membrane protein YbhN (UPF0104 family)